MDSSFLAQLKEAAGRRTQLLTSLKEAAGGAKWCAAHTALLDELVRECFAVASKAWQQAESVVALVATGGYGRSELAPYSDLDVAVIPSTESAPELEPFLRILFNLLDHTCRDEFGIGLGYQFVTQADIPGLDSKTRTGFLDSRLVAGSAEVLQGSLDRLEQSLAPAEFLIDKFAERKRAAGLFGDTPLVVEAHLKLGVGGLRDFHCANWIRRALREPKIEPSESYDYLLEARNLLHLVSGRRQDILTRQRQGEICELTDFDLFDWNSRLCLARLDQCAAFEESIRLVHSASFQVSANCKSDAGSLAIEPDCDASEAAYSIGLATTLGLEVPRTSVQLRPEVEGERMLAAIRVGEEVLRNCDQAGVLETALPELTDCRTLMPSDSLHQFTVFEHTLRVIRNLGEAASHLGLFGELRASIADLGPLYLAALLHDVGKRDPSGPHSETGERMAREVASRWELDPSAADLVCWLVREHLTMARFLRMRDLGIPETSAEFAGIVGNADRLNMLTLLTWADIAAVSDESWSPVLESFTRELHQRTMAVLVSEADTPSEALTRTRLLRSLAKLEVPEAEIEAFVDRLPAAYLAANTPELVREHFVISRRAQQGEPTVEFYDLPGKVATEITVCALDQQALLSRVLGVLYGFDLSVVSIRALTTREEQPVALDVITVTYRNQSLPPSLCRQVQGPLTDVLQGQLDLEAFLEARGKDPGRELAIIDYTFRPGLPAILEVRAPRGRGMAFRITNWVSSKGWNIHSARIGQWAGQGAAALYIDGPGHTQVTREQVESAFDSLARYSS